MLSLLWEMVPCLLAGALIGRCRPQWINPLATPLVRFGVPLSLMGLLLHGGLNRSLLLMALLSVTAIGLMLALLRGSGLITDALVMPDRQLASCIGNTAYFGIPAALALLPPEALPVSIGYDFGATLLAWGLGPLWLHQANHQGHGYNWGSLASHLMASPATRGLIGALIVLATPWSDAISAGLWLPSRVVIVLALAVVGMRLGTISLRTPSSVPERLLPPLVCKLLLFPMLMLLISLPLPLPLLAKKALVLQAAAPTAISVLLIAESGRCDASASAQLILRSTLIALISVPLWSVVLNRLF